MEWLHGQSEATPDFEDWLIGETGLTTYDFERLCLPDEEDACDKELTGHLLEYKRRTGFCGIK